jgi:hypothetical protein
VIGPRMGVGVPLLYQQTDRCDFRRKSVALRGDAILSTDGAWANRFKLFGRLSYEDKVTIFQAVPIIAFVDQVKRIPRQTCQRLQPALAPSPHPEELPSVQLATRARDTWLDYLNFCGVNGDHAVATAAANC